MPYRFWGLLDSCLAARVLNQFAYFLRHTDSTLGFDKANGEAAQSGDVLGTVSCANAAAVFIVVPVNDIMATIFYTPMLTVRRKDFSALAFSDLQLVTP